MNFSIYELRNYMLDNDFLRENSYFKNSKVSKCLVKEDNDEKLVLILNLSS